MAIVHNYTVLRIVRTGLNTSEWLLKS